MIFGPVIGYVSQYRLISRTESVGNFSIDVCAILLTANILRIFYWYSDRFSTALLLQSILMIIAQILLLKLCINTKDKTSANSTGQSKILIPLRKSRRFWRWSTFQSYILFLSSYSFALGILTLFFVDFLKSKSYGQVIGFLSLSIEATLGFPQMIKNCKQKSIEGISIFLIMTWFVGDLAKTVYFVYYEQPLQFVLCGCVQLTVDVIILGQLFVYRGEGMVEDVESIQAVDKGKDGEMGESEEQL